MYTDQIMLSDIKTVKEFVDFANRFKFKIMIKAGKYVINGKSIMGIFALDLTKPLLLEVKENCSEEFKKGVQPFLAKQKAS